MGSWGNRTEIFQMIQTANRHDLNRSKFKKGRQSVRDDNRSGLPFSLTTREFFNMKSFRKVINPIKVITSWRLRESIRRKLPEPEQCFSQLWLTLTSKLISSFKGNKIRITGETTDDSNHCPKRFQRYM